MTKIQSIDSTKKPICYHQSTCPKIFVVTWFTIVTGNSNDIGTDKYAAYSYNTTDNKWTKLWATMLWTLTNPIHKRIHTVQSRKHLRWRQWLPLEREAWKSGNGIRRVSGVLTKFWFLTFVLWVIRKSFSLTTVRVCPSISEAHF